MPGFNENIGIDIKGHKIDVNYNQKLTYDNNELIYKSEVENISGYLQSQIDNISGGGSGSDATLIGGSGISVVESPVDTWTISVSGDYVSKSGDTMTGDLTISKDTGRINFDYPGSSGVGESHGMSWKGGASILEYETTVLPAFNFFVIKGSGYSTQILSGEGKTIANYITVTDTYNYADSSIRYNDTTNIMEVDGTIQSSTLEFNTDKILITNVDGKIVASTLDVNDIANISTVASISGNLQNQINDNYTLIQNISGSSDTILIGGNGISVIEGTTDAWTVSISGDFATNSVVASISGSLQTQIDNIVEPDIFRSEVENVSANLSLAIYNLDVDLQSQIDNISGGGSGSDAILLSGNGISVVEYPADTWTISVSGYYATTTDVNNLDVSLTSLITDISGNLQTQIDNIIEPDIFRSEVQNVSGYLQSQIDNISGGGSGSDAILLAGNGIYIVESPSDTWTISVSGNYILSSEVQNISAGLNTRIITLEGNPVPDIFRSEVSAISAGLQNGIDNNYNNIILLTSNVSDLSAANIIQDGRLDDLESRPIADIFRAEVQNVSGSIQSQIDNIIEPDIFRSEVENVSGYLQNGIDANYSIIQSISGSSMLIGGPGIQVIESPSDTWTISVSGDYILSSEVENVSAGLNTRIITLEGNPVPDIFRSEVASISGDLQNQINNIDQESTIIIGGSGISVIEYPNQTFTVSVSADYATPSDLNNLDVSLTSLVVDVSGNLQTQITLNDNDISDLQYYDSQVAGITADHESRILTLEGIPVPDIFRTEIESISGYLQTQITSNDNDISGLRSDVDTISGDLDSLELQLYNAYETTGLIHDELPTVSWNESTRELTIGACDFYYRGIKYSYAGSVETVPDITQSNFYYFDSNGNLTSSITAWDILTTVPVALVIWNSTLQEGKLLEERHTTAFNPIDHKYEHTTFGARIESGFAISDYTLDDDTDNQLSIASGKFWDEDIEDEPAGVASSGPYSIWYRIGTSEWRWNDTQTVPFLTGVGGAIEYNLDTAGTFSLVELGNPLEEFVNYYAFATNIMDMGGIILIAGQEKYSSLPAAQAESVGDIDFGNLLGLIPEAVALYQITYRTKNNIDGAEIASVKSIQGTNLLSVQTGTTSHNALSGLQGGTTNEYYHLTSSEYADYIGKTEVENVSGSLQSQIDNIIEPDIFRAEVENVSGYLQSQIDNISGSDATLIGENGISVIESPIYTWTISVSGDYILSSEVQNISAGLNTRIINLENNPVPDIFRSEVSNISGSLQTQIDNIIEESTTISSSGGSITVSQNGYNFNLEVATSPVVDHNSLDNIQGGTTDEYYHLTAAEYDDYIGKTEVAVISAGLNSRIITLEVNPVPDIFRAEVTSISGNLQSQIDNISISGSGIITPDTTVIHGVAAFATSGGGELEDLGVDANLVGYIGRAAIGYVGGTDFAALSHRDMANVTDFCIGQNSDGDTTINSKSGREISLRNNNTNIAIVDTDGISIVSSKSLLTTDADTTHTLGRAAIGYADTFSDIATFAHRDNMNSTDYSILQTGVGRTIVNAKSGQAVVLRNANVDVASVSSIGVLLVGGKELRTYRADNARYGSLYTDNTGTKLESYGATNDPLILNARGSGEVRLQSGDTTITTISSTGLTMSASKYIYGASRLYMAGAGGIVFYTSGGSLTHSFSDIGGIRGVGVYSTTTASAANVFVDTDGTLKRSTSSRKYKDNINYDTEIEFSSIVDKLKSVSFTSAVSGSEFGKSYIGLVAEDVEMVDPRLVYHDDNGNPEGVQYANIVAPLISKVQQQQNTIDMLISKIQELENRINSM